MKFLIVVPKNTRQFNFYDLPIGLAYISSTLKKNGYFVDVLNLNEYYGHLDCNDWAPLKMLLKRKIKEENDIDIVCVGGLSPHYDIVKAILDKSRDIKPNITTIVGGGLLSSEPIIILEALKANFGVVGEGEVTILELANEIKGSRNFNKINGIVYLNSDGRAILNTRRKPIDNIDSIPYPDYEDFGVENYLAMQIPADISCWFPFDKPRVMPIVTSRSCPLKCTFCYHPIGNKYRERSLNSIFSEIEYLISKYSVNMLMIVDELFGINREKLEKFCQEIRRYNLRWGAQLHVTTVNKEILSLMKDAGCNYISYGIESASDIVLKSMKKHTNISQIERALELTYNAKIQIQGNLIFGDKAETWETANETLMWWLNHRKYQINLSQVIPYPGSELYYDAINRGLINDRIEFIKNGCSRLSQLNLTKMTNEQYCKFLEIITKYNLEDNRIPGKVISFKKVKIDAKKGPLYSAEIECPHCKNITQYSNMHNGKKPSICHVKLRWGCRECFQRFDLLPCEFEEKILSIINEGGHYKIGIIGANDRTKLLLKSSFSLKENVVCVIDDEYFRGLSDVEGIKVIPLNNNLGEIKNLVDAIVVNYEPDKELTEQLFQLGNLGIKIYSLTNVFDFYYPIKEGDRDGAVSYIKFAFEHGNTAISKGQFEEAHYIFLSLIETFPKLSVAHIALAEVAINLGDFSVALDAICTANLLSPNNPFVVEFCIRHKNFSHSQHFTILQDLINIVTQCNKTEGNYLVISPFYDTSFITYSKIYNNLRLYHIDFCKHNFCENMSCNREWKTVLLNPPDYRNRQYSFKKEDGFRFAFVDSNHNFSDVAVSVLTFWDNLSRGSLFLYNDYQYSDYSEFEEFISIFKKEFFCKIVKERNGLICLRKTSNLPEKIRNELTMKLKARNNLPYEKEKLNLQVYRVASLYQSAKDYERSEKLFKQLIKQADNKTLISGAYFHLGEIAYVSGNYKKAMSHFSKCLVLNPDHKKAEKHIKAFRDKNLPIL